MSERTAVGQDSPLGEDALRALIEQAPDAIFVADVEGRYVYVNSAGCRMLGYSRDELLGKTILDTLPAKDARRLARSKAVMLAGRTHKAVWTMQRKDGTALPVEVHANILPNGQWQAFVRDISERKALQAEREALFARIETDRRRLKTVVDTFPLGVLLFEPDGTVTANRRTEELIGVKIVPQAGAAQYADRIYHPDGTPVATEDLVASRVSRGEAVVAEEYLVRRPDGSMLPVLASGAPIHDREGRNIGGVAVFQDVSERMRLEQSVRENERLLHAVFDILPVGVWIADKDGRIASNNPAAERIWCGARHVPMAEYGEYKGWWVETGQPIAAQDWALARAVRDGETCAGELVRIACFDGSYKTIINSAAPLRGENGEILGAIVVNEDITALHEAQERLRESERMFRTIFDLLPVGLWIADRDGTITQVNPAGQRIWQGVRPAGPEHYGELKGWWVDSGKPLEAHEWGIPRAIREGATSIRKLIRIQCFDGSFKTVINWATPIRSHDGQIAGAIAVNEDITALHQTQEQLRTAVRDREDILAVVTHDLRSPLSAITTVAATLELKARSLPGGEPLRTMAATLSDIASRMSGLVNDLLSVAMARTDRSVLKITPTQPAALLERAADAARPMFAREGIGFKLQIVGQLPVIQVDSNRILRVFSNLFDNAIKFTGRPGEVVLRAEEQSGGVRFCVANSGPALSPKELESIFQPFWQAARGDARGAGLGLSISRSIVEAHGGSIWAEPVAGMRVRICMLLPSAIPAGLSAASA